MTLMLRRILAVECDTEVTEMPHQKIFLKHRLVIFS